MLEGAEVSESARTVAGTLLGVRVIFRLTERSLSDSSEQWTEIDVAAPTDMVLVLRPPSMWDKHCADRELLTDVEVGDPAFDESFVIDGAPAGAVRLVLDADIRQRLMRLRPFELATEHGAGLRMAKRGWLVDADVVRELIHVATSVGVQASRALHQHVENEAQRAIGAEYRGVGEAEARARVQHRAAAEIAHVKATAAKRGAFQFKVLLLGVGVITAVSLMIQLLQRLFGSP